jgi:hypothetical protein
MTKDSTERERHHLRGVDYRGGYDGGLWSAIKATENGCSVTDLVDKSFAGKSWHSYFASGPGWPVLPR